jgi:hypothetical protein
MRFLLPLMALAPLAAQTVVSPNHYTTAEANSYSSDGFGTTTTPNRYLEIHTDMQGSPITINKITYRRDGGSVNTTTMAAYTILCDVFLSTAATTASAPSATFDNNHGANKQQVLSFGLVQFPVTQPGVMPRPWEYPIPLTTAYAHAGAGPLCTELRISSRTNTGTNYLDWTTGANTNPAPDYRTFGTGCRYTATGSRVTISGGSSATWAQSSVTLSMYGANVKANTLAYMSIGISDEFLGGIPLPFELPGTSAGPSGPCNIYNDILITIPTLANASGQTTVNLGLGVSPGYNGLSLFSQLISLDPAANNWGIVLSNGLQHHIIAPFTTGAVGEVYNNNGVGATGTVRANAGLVTKFN